jgi:hypothetical protein
MSIQKKSLISSLKATKKANIVKGAARSTSAVKSASTRGALVKSKRPFSPKMMKGF